MSYRQFAYYYDRLMEDTPYGEWIRFAETCWTRYGRPQTVVDLGCGTGNIAIPLAQSGLRVTGIDLSEDMLAVARAKAEQLLGSAASFPSGGSVAWVQQDMREWQLPRPADCVLSFCDCLNYLLEEEDIVQALRRAYEGLKPGGLFIFDVHTPGQLETYAVRQPFVLDEEDIAYIWTCDFDADRCEIEHHLTIFVQQKGTARQGGDAEAGETERRPVAGSGAFRDKERAELAYGTAAAQHAHGGGKLFRRIEEVHVQRAYALDWLERELRRSGFAEVNCYADFTWQPPSAGTQRAFFVARRG